MRLPGAERAVIDLAKLRDYCLNPEHPRGRHKARVFAAALGLTAEHADRLRDALLVAALEGNAVAGEADQYGRRYVLDFTMSTPAGQARVRSSWIIRPDEDFPRLTSCYVHSRPWTNMTNPIQLLDVVALLEDLPEKGLRRGQVGTAVEELGPRVFEVEFSDDEGRTYASLALRAEQLMVLHHRPVQSV
jgi:hypothetical protein